MADLFSATYNPDVLSCLANLSNDEVFTPPELANQVLDLLPEELWSDPNTTFLDPCCKSGVFLREIAKRLIKGLENEIPDLQERLDHIYHKQLFGIAITEITSLLSRRSLYCSKFPNGRYSVSTFDTAEGNIRFREIEHSWYRGRCLYCGASQRELGEDREGLETHAYDFIHLDNIEELFDMKFDVIVGNPPYQLQVNEAGKGLGAIPLYQKFVEQAIKMNPRFLTMIIPSRWFAGGVGLNNFRKMMLTSHKLSTVVDFIDSNDCFPGVDINGGVCYFLWERDYVGDCDYTSIDKNRVGTSRRKLDEFDIFIRRNEALSIVKKVLSKGERTLSEPGGCSPQTPYGLLSTFAGAQKKGRADDLKVLSSKGWMYVARGEINKAVETIDMYKPMISKLSSEHAGNPDKEGTYRVLSRMELLEPGEICTQSYLTVCPSASKYEAQHALDYLKTKLVRFLILQSLVGMNISTSNFMFIPWQDFSKPWTDEELYAKYGLTDEEISFIESMIRPMDLDGSDA